MKPLFSIVTPSFHQLEWLKICVASVRDQADALNPRIPSLSVEHIIQDGGSAKLEEFAKQIGARFFLDGSPPSVPTSFDSPPLSYHLVIHQEDDAGMYDAINRGLRKAKGDYLAYINCDEQYLPGTLRTIADTFDQHPDVDIIFGDTLLLDINCQPVSYRRVVRPSPRYLRHVSPNLFSCAMFFRRRIIDDGIFFEKKWRVIGDAVWMYRVFQKYHPYFLRQPIAAFVLTGSNLSSGTGQKTEWTQWSGNNRRSVQWLCHLLNIQQRLQKLAAGAYGRHRVETALFTPSSPEQRVPVKMALGSHWPSASTSESAASQPV